MVAAVFRCTQVYRHITPRQCFRFYRWATDFDVATIVVAAVVGDAEGRRGVHHT